MKKVKIEDLNDLLIVAKAICPNPIGKERPYTQLNEGIEFVNQFLELTLSLNEYLLDNFLRRDPKVGLGKKTTSDVTKFFEELNEFFTKNYFMGGDSTTWIKSIMLLYGIVSYHKALFLIGSNTIEEFEMGKVIEELEMTLYENTYYENLLYLEKKQLFFMELKELRKKKK